MRSGVIWAWLWVAACGCTFDPPPEVSLDYPRSGAFGAGEPLSLRFSEPIRSDSLIVRVWPAETDAEGELVAGLQPRLGDCRPARCEGAELTVSADGQSARLDLESDYVTGGPWTLEVAAGLSDTAGRRTGTSAWFDFLVTGRPPRSEEPEDRTAPFQGGVYLVLAPFGPPLPVQLTLLVDFDVTPAGAFASVATRAMPIPGAPPTSEDPSQLRIDDTERGFVLYSHGRIVIDGGAPELRTEPTELAVTVGGLSVRLTNLRLNALIVTDPATGAHRLDGTMSFGSAVLTPAGGEPFEQVGSTAAFSAHRVPEGLVPAGVGRVCGELCPAGGPTHCGAPDGFPGAEYCNATR